MLFILIDLYLGHKKKMKRKFPFMWAVLEPFDMSLGSICFFYLRLFGGCDEFEAVLFNLAICPSHHCASVFLVSAQRSATQ